MKKKSNLFLFVYMVSPSPFLEPLPAIPALHIKPICATVASLDLWAVANPCWLVFQEASTTPRLVPAAPCQHWELHEIPPCDCAHHKHASRHSVQPWKTFLHPLADRVGCSQ